MKKRFKVLLPSVLTVVSLMLSAVPVFGADGTGGGNSGFTGKEVIKTLEEASNVDNGELRPFVANGLKDKGLSDAEFVEKNKVKKEAPAIKKTLEENPEEFSGMYYDDEKGTIVVQVTKDSEEVKNKVKNKIKNKDKVEFKTVKYSKKDIDESKKRIKKEYKDGQVQVLIPDVKNNKLIVMVKDDKDGNLKNKIESLATPGLVEIKKATIKAEKLATDEFVYPGEIPGGARITGEYLSDPSGDIYFTACSVGFHAVDAFDSNVLVTSGHCRAVNPNPNSYTGSQWFQFSDEDRAIGNYSRRTFSSQTDGSDGVSDSGYIAYYPGVSGSPSVAYPSQTDRTPIVGAYISELVGDTVYFRGSSTGYLTKQTIRYTNVDFFWGEGGYAYNDNEILTTGQDAIRGDSGGTVAAQYAWDNNRGGYTFKIAGIITGRVWIEEADSDVVEAGIYNVYDPIWMVYRDLRLKGIKVSQ
ncbi:hypothetical protein ACP26L_36425 (plasmid) [Paenibacillus sp. S-38]|uniref:hypothetical protein n=1 Tax=Paenibacillus sp. S-38 TaxID=3416710 RepID=UPI003CEE291B